SSSRSGIPVRITSTCRGYGMIYEDEDNDANDGDDDERER
ncbi:hypothetical protein Tco_0562814, partial [Tanacetum coccineum]